MNFTCSPFHANLVAGVQEVDHVCNTGELGHWSLLYVQPVTFISSHLNYPLTARVVWAPQMICNQFLPFFPVLHCPLGLSKLQACLFPDVVFPPLPLSALSSSRFCCALQDSFGQTWWTGDMTIPLQFVSLYNGQEVLVWSNCLLLCWILAQTSSLVTGSLYDMCSILR